MVKPNLSVVEELPKLKPLARKSPAVATKVKQCGAQFHNIRKFIDVVYVVCLHSSYSVYSNTRLCVSVIVQLFVYVSSPILLHVISINALSVNQNRNPSNQIDSTS